MAPGTQPKKMYEQSFSFVANAEHFIMFKAFVHDASLVTHLFTYTIGVNEETFRLLKFGDDSSVSAKYRSVLDSINEEVTNRNLSLVPFKCTKCPAKATVATFQLTVLRDTALPIILNMFSLPSCETCALVVQNHALDACGQAGRKAMVKGCANCEKMGTDFKCCSRCTAVFYCSKECQRHHWNKGGHKKLCYKK